MKSHSYWERWTAAIRDRFRGSTTGPQPGLHTYPLHLDGGQRRLHLRIHPDGTGMLFVDVTDVIHLNPTAAHMAWMALERIPLARAQRQLYRHYRGVKRRELADAAKRIYAMVDRLRDQAGACPVCAIASEVQFQPLFSLPARAPYKVDFALTYACNNNCPHCYNEPERFTMRPLDKDDAFRVIDKLVAIGVPHLILTGGEPTLYPWLLELVHYADQRGLIVGMNTNGRRLARPTLARDLAEAGLNHVQITLEASQAEVHDAMVGVTGAFHETVAGIKNALSAGLLTITNTTLTRQNQHLALETIAFLHELGLTTFAMNGIIHAGGGLYTPDAIPAEDMYALLAAIRDTADELNMRFLWYTVTDYCQLSPLELGLDPKRCNAGEYSMCIEPNGDVLPCQSYYVSVGNILRDPWDSIWNSDLFLRFRNRGRHPKESGLPQKCWNCPDLPVCGGGCPLEHEALAAGSTIERASERGCGRASGRALVRRPTRSSEPEELLFFVHTDSRMP